MKEGGSGPTTFHPSSIFPPSTIFLRVPSFLPPSSFGFLHLPPSLPLSSSLPSFVVRLSFLPLVIPLFLPAFLPLFRPSVIALFLPFPSLMPSFLKPQAASSLQLCRRRRRLQAASSLLLQCFRAVAREERVRRGTLSKHWQLHRCRASCPLEK